MPLAAYTVTALVLLWLAHRFVRPLSGAAAMLLFLLPFAFAGHALLTGRVYAPLDLPYESVPLNWMKSDYDVTRVSTGIHSDVFTEFIPWRRATQWSLSRGEWGLWNPFVLCGDVLLGMQQAAVFSPLTLIAVLMPAALSFTFTGAITLFIAALCAFLLARELGCSEGASMIAAAGWAFCTVIVLFLLVTMSGTWAWCPLLFVGIRRVVERASMGSGALLTFAFTALLYSGHPESLVLSVLIGLLFGMFELARTRRNVVRAALTACAAGAIALLLSAIHLLPFLEAMPHTLDHAHRVTLFAQQDRGAPAFESAARIATTFFPYLHAREWKTANVRQPWFDVAAVGSIVLALAIYALVRVRTATALFFGALALFSLLVHAEWGPLIAVLQRVPVLDMTLLDRLSYGAALSLVILAALGVDELARRVRDRAAVITFAVLLAVIVAGNWWIARSPLVSHEPQFWGEYKVAAEIAGLAIALLVVAFTRSPRWLVPALLGLVVAQRVVEDGGIQRSFTPRQAYPPILMLAPLEQVREPFRVVGHGTALVPQTNIMYGLEDPRGFPSMTHLRLFETYSLWSIHQPVFYNRVDDLTRPFLSFLNVRYAITWDRDPPPPGWREVSRQRGAMLIENMNAIERAFVPRSVRVGAPAHQYLEEMSRATDFRERAWISADTEPHERTNGPGRLALRVAKLGYDIDADMESDGWIVTSVTAWPGWRAYVDGRRVKTQIANHAFVSVYVPRGRHHVRLKYWPESFVRGRAITLATLASVIAFGFWRRLRAGRA